MRNQLSCIVPGQDAGLSLLCPRARSPRPCQGRGSGWWQDLLHPCVLSQELLQGFDNGPEGVGCLWDGRGGAVEGAAVISALLPEVRRDRGTFDVEDPGVHHFTVNLHHHLLPIDHILCKRKEKKTQVRVSPAS